MKLIINSIIGGILIYIVNLVGASFGISIGLNLFTSVFVGITGIPGVIILVLLIVNIHKSSDKLFKNMIKLKRE